MSDLLNRAVRFARKAHESIDQRRKYTNEPYFNHPKEVAALLVALAEGSISEHQIAAAYLHDVVEDTPVTLAEIRREFGPKIASLVAELTNVSKPEDGNRARRKQIDREHLRQASPEAKSIKLADVISNVTGIARLDPEFARVYLVEKQALLEELTDGDPRLWEHAQRTINTQSALIAPVRAN